MYFDSLEGLLYSYCKSVVPELVDVQVLWPQRVEVLMEMERYLR